ncbi:MAG: hypothetical protein F4Z04_00215 [Acidobacteria bacterium]|nr:hypothetical protein [Acidobacteriota bacterium]
MRQAGSLTVYMLALAVPLALPLAAAAQSGAPTPGAPALVEAARADDAQGVKALIDAGADVNARQGDGAGALHWATHRDNLAIARLLIDAGADPNAANDLDATPLWLAAENGSAPITELLLDAGANPDLTLAMGETPLMIAARSGAAETVALLLDAGASPNAAEREREQTALMWAAAQGHADVAQLLLDAGADLTARSRVWDQLENTAGNTNTSGNFRMSHGGSTPLLFAARGGDVETARVLIEAGADPNETAAAGTSALVIAAHSGHGPLGIFLLEQGADPNAAAAGYTALHAAVLRSQAALAEALLDHGAEVDALVEHGTPGRRFSADFSIRHQWIGANAFWLAARYGEPEILHILAEHGADPHVMPANRMSALQAAMGITRNAAENRRNQVDAPEIDPDQLEQLTLDIVRRVLEMGVDVNLSDERGDTALHHAVRIGFASVVDLLASNGARLDATNERGETALALAESQLPIPGSNGLRASRPEIADLLRRLGAN